MVMGVSYGKVQVDHGVSLAVWIKVMPLLGFVWLIFVIILWLVWSPCRGGGGNFCRSPSGSPDRGVSGYVGHNSVGFIGGGVDRGLCRGGVVDIENLRDRSRLAVFAKR